MRLAQALRKRMRWERLNRFPPAEAALKRTLIHNLISVLLRSRSSGVSSAACNGGDDPLWYLNCSPQLRFASLSFLSSLANSCTFLVGVWRIIKDLARSALATVLGRRRRVLFLVQLKNRKIFSLHFLCLSCNTHDSGCNFSSWKWEKLGTPTGFQG